MFTRTINMRCVVFEHQRPEDTAAAVLHRMAEYAEYLQTHEPAFYIQEVRFDFTDDGFPRGVMYISRTED